MPKIKQQFKKKNNDKGIQQVHAHIFKMNIKAHGSIASVKQAEKQHLKNRSEQNTDRYDTEKGDQSLLSSMVQTGVASMYQVNNVVIKKPDMNRKYQANKDIYRKRNSEIENYSAIIKNKIKN